MFFGVKLNGVPVPPGDYSELDTTKIEWSRTDTEGKPTFRYAEQVRFTGNTAANIRAELLCTSDRSKFLIFELTDECCTPGDVLFRGKISADNVAWCEIKDGEPAECDVTVDAEEYSEESQALACLRDALVLDNNDWPDGVKFHDRAHPFVRYCSEQRPKFVAFAFLFVLVCLNFLFITQLPLLILISVIIGAINAIIAIVGGDSIGDTINAFLAPANAILDFFTNELPAFFSGCGRGHVTPLVRDYIKNVCYRCDLEFASPTLNDPASPYYNLAYFLAQAKQGRVDYDSQARKDWRKINGPVASGVLFLNDICKSLNHEWEINAGVLTVKPKDAVTAVPAIDFTLPPNKAKIIEFCVDAQGEPTPYAISLRTTRDALDACGNETAYLYDDVVPYTPPDNQNLGGLEEVTVPHAAAAFRQDGVDGPDALQEVKFLFDIPPISLFPISPFNNPVDYLLRLEKAICTAPKLLALQENFDVNNALVVRDKYQSGNYKNTFYHYNWPVWYAAVFFSTPAYTGPNAADYAIWYADGDPDNSQKVTKYPGAWEFFIADDPRTIQAFRTGRQGTMRVAADCEFINALVTQARTTGRLFVKVPLCNGQVIAEITSLKYNRTDIDITLNL